MKIKLLVVAITVFAGAILGAPTLAEAQEVGSEIQDVSVNVTSIRVNRFNDVRVYLDSAITCGSYSGSTNTPYILDNHIGAAEFFDKQAPPSVVGAGCSGAPPRG